MTLFVIQCSFSARNAMNLVQVRDMAVFLSRNIPLAICRVSPREKCHDNFKLNDLVDRCQITE